MLAFDPDGKNERYLATGLRNCSGLLRLANPEPRWSAEPRDDLKGQVPCGFVVLNAGVNRDPAEIEREAVELVRERIGAVASMKRVVTVKRLPKTRSGKVLRATMQKIADRQPWTMPATIDDPAILEEIAEALRGQEVI